MVRRLALVCLCTAVLAVGWSAKVAEAGQCCPVSSEGVAYAVQDLGDDQLYTIDLANGTATAIGPTGFAQIDGIALSPSGVLYGISTTTDELVTIDTTTGVATAVGPLGIDVGDTGISFDRHGVLYMATEGPLPATLYLVSTTTGAATPIGLQPQQLSGLAITCDGAAFALGEDTDDTWSLDLATGAGTRIGPTGGVATNNADLTLSGVTLWGINSVGALFVVNPATGAAAVQFTVAPGFESLAATSVCTETPATPPVETTPSFTG